MDGFEELEDDGGDTVFRDVIMLALAGFVAIVIMLLPHLNPVASAEEETPSPGNVIVEIRWPDQYDADVDLWVAAPDDRAVGYSNSGGLIFNLLRDDLGHAGDVSGVNYEVSYSRGVPAGEYVVNLHLYRNQSGIYPMPVTVVVSVKNNPRTSAKQIIKTDLALSRMGEELTAVRFQLNDEGKLVPGSIHDLPRMLRNKGT